jgi:lysophospholipase L1-like esterase
MAGPFTSETYQSGDGNLNEPITVGRLGQPVRIGGGTEWQNIGRGPIAYRPSAADFGAGIWRDGKITYISDGVNFTRDNSALRTKPVRIVAFGDSTADITVGSSNPNIQDLQYLTAAFPASGFSTLNLTVNKFATSLFYRQAYLVGNCGISGQTTTQMIARDNEVASTTRRAIADALNLFPDVIFLRCGINDLTTATPSTINSLVATTYTNKIKIINRFLSAGVHVIDESIHGFSLSSVPDLASVRLAVVSLNNLSKSYADASGGKITYLSPIGVLSDATGAYLAGMSHEGTHLSAAGAYELGRQEAACLTGLFGASSGPRYPGINMTTNPLFSATDTSAQGVIATGLFINGTNATCLNCAIEDIDGATYQTTIVTPSSASNSCSIFSPYTPKFNGGVSGDIWGVEFDFFIDGVDGANAPSMTTIRAWVTTVKIAAGSVVSAAIISTYTPTAIAGQYKGHAIFQPTQIMEDAANLSATSAISFVVETNSLLPYKVGVGPARCVKLGVSTTSL